MRRRYIDDSKLKRHVLERRIDRQKNIICMENNGLMNRLQKNKIQFSGFQSFFEKCNFILLKQNKKETKRKNGNNKLKI